MFLRMLSSAIWHVGCVLYEGEEAVYKLTSSSTAGGGLQRRTRVCTVRFPPPPPQMPFGGVTVKDVDSHEFVLALASYFKKQMV